MQVRLGMYGLSVELSGCRWGEQLALMRQRHSEAPLSGHVFFVMVTQTVTQICKYTKAMKAMSHVVERGSLCFNHKHTHVYYVCCFYLRHARKIIKTIIIQWLELVGSPASWLLITCSTGEVILLGADHP